MITIGICDDMEVFRRDIREKCEKFFTENQLSYQCIEFASGEEILAYEGEQIQLLFLDIELGSISGIEVKTGLEKKDTVSKIVFVTGYDHYMRGAFGTKTLGFVDKPIKNSDVNRWLGRVLEEIQADTVYEFEMNNEIFLVKLREIMYLESAGNYTYLYKRGEKVLLCKQLKVCHEKLDVTCMLRIHKRYVINLLNVETWRIDKVLLTDGTKLSIGRKYREDAEEGFKHFLRNKAY